MGTLEVDESAPELRFLGRNRRRDIVDKSQSYLSLGCQCIYVRELGEYGKEISSKEENQKLTGTNFKDDGLRI